MRTTRHKKTICPGCGANLNASSSGKQKTPSVGDISVCVNCAQPFQYAEGLLLVALPWETVVALDREDPGLLMKVEKMRAAVEAREGEYGEGN